ncbi:GDSL esterase/lipase At1g71250 [Oryza brachyantha]|uniref:GDSL esterase/lipase At1g71250 n=1 Tax=Oryza brachyantha TaxID=4533 RepID=UPI0003EA96A0|nr:GDSL esterase/lipase At1g71250 [Oryza brachyantha]
MATAAVVGTLVLLSSSAAAAARSVPAALFVFGDSLVDDGNNNALSCLAKANFFPYGVDFPGGGGAAAGRFCNGKTFVDALCDLLGLQYVPPFATTTTTTGLNGTSLLAGVNYASAAGGILDETGQHLGERFSLSEQVLNMESNLETIRSLMEDRIQGGYDMYLARSIVVMVLGSNDYINNYLLTSLYDSGYTYSPEDYADLLINHYTRQILALYSVGLRKFLLAGVGPLGCIPRLRASGLGPLGRCVDQVNQMVGFFNQGLRSLVGELNADHPDAIFLYGNTYYAIYDMLNNPYKYGFRVVDSGCCVEGEDGTCEAYAEPCESREQHVFWDAYHPTEAVNLVLAESAFNGTPDHVYPLNLQQLADL